MTKGSNAIAANHNQGQWLEIEQGRLYWQPHCFSSAEADTLFRQLDQELNWQQQKIKIYGREVLQPRLQAWCGDAVYTYSGLTMQPDPWTPALLLIRDKLEGLLGTPFNSVLANKYRDGADSMGWHQDNESELGQMPIIASISLGETRRFVLKHMLSKEKLEYQLTHGALLVMAGETQTYWQHAVPKTCQFKQSRINLTFRYIAN